MVTVDLTRSERRRTSSRRAAGLSRTRTVTVRFAPIRALRTLPSVAAPPGASSSRRTVARQAAGPGQRTRIGTRPSRNARTGGPRRTVLGAVRGAGTAAATTALGADVAVALPARLARATTARRRAPTSCAVRVSDVPVAPGISRQSPPSGPQRSQRRTVVPGLPSNTAPSAVSDRPASATPPSAGGVTTAGETM